MGYLAVIGLAQVAADGKLLADLGVPPCGNAPRYRAGPAFARARIVR